MTGPALRRRLLLKWISWWDRSLSLRDKLLFVMGSQRSGTTVLFDSFAQDSSLEAHPESDSSLFYHQFLLRPERELRPIIWRKRRRLLLKPISEVQIRSVDAVLTEFQDYGPQVAWIYRDPVNVWASNRQTFGYGDREFETWLAGWNQGNRSVLDALRGPFGDRISLVRYEDLLSDPACFEGLCALVAARPINPLFRSADRGRGRELDDAARQAIEAATKETLAALNDARSARGTVAVKSDEVPRNLEGPWRLASIGAHAVAVESPTGSPEVVRLDVARPARGGVRIERGPFPILAPGRHGFHLWGRSDQPQSVRFAAGPRTDTSGPGKPWIAGNMRIQSEWRGERFEFEAPLDEAATTLNFWTGHRPGLVELAVPNVAAAPPLPESLELEEGAAAHLRRSPDDPSHLFISIDALGRGQPADIRLVVARQVVTAGAAYAVSFLCRGDGARSLGVAVSEDEPPFRRLQHYQVARAGAEWTTVRVEFTATYSGPLRLCLELGDDATALEVDRAVFIQLAANLCALLVVDGCGAALERDPARPEFTRVRITRSLRADPYQIQLTRRLAPLRRGSRYGIDFRIRAEAPRALGVGVGVAIAPAELRNLGFFFELEASPAWKSYHFEFEPSWDADVPLLHFDLGQDEASVELHGVRCQPIDSEISPAETRHLLRVASALGAAN